MLLLLNKQSAAAPPAFNYTDVAGLQLWLDPTDTGTVSSTTTNINAITNKGTAGGNATSSLTLRPQNNRTLNSLPSIDFSTGQVLLLPSTIYGLSAGANTLFIVFASDNTGDASQNLYSGRNSGGGFRVGTRFTTTQYEMANRTNTTVAAITPLVDTRSTATKIVGYRRSGTSLVPFNNGTQGANIANSEDFTMFDAQLGAQDPAATINRLDGRISQVLQYDSNVSDINCNLIGNKLATTFGGTWAGF